MKNTTPQNQRAISRLASFGHALRGVKTLLVTQPNARIHLVAACAVTVLGWSLRLSALEWAVIALTVGMVIGAEALNTAIEFVVDLASPEWHALARDAKDVAAAAVLLGSLAAVVVGAIIFVPKIASICMPFA